MSGEFRRRPRATLTDIIPVVDAMTGETVGHIGNLSETGMLLIANTAMADDALYQFRFRLTGADRRETEYELGAHLLWKDEQSAPGMVWTGFRFLAVPEKQIVALRAWIDRAQGPATV